MYYKQNDMANVWYELHDTCVCYVSKEQRTMSEHFIYHKVMYRHQLGTKKV